MRIPALIAFTALSAASAAAQTTTWDFQNQSITPNMQVLDVHVGGRVKIEPLPAPLPAGAKTYIHQWPGVYFESAFEGQKVVVKLDDAANEYRLLIDDLTPIILGQLGKAEVTVSDLKPGPHRLRLERVTESMSQIGAFDGFYVPADAKPLPVKARARQIEFIGASGETGYGIRSAVKPCTQDTVRLTSDTQANYAALTAKHFDADYQINAISGRGLVRNIAGIIPDLTMSATYPFTLLDKTAPYADPSWRPQIILYGLGGNDFSTALKPGEKWKSREELVADYTKAFGDLIAQLHKRSPSASVLTWWPRASELPNADYVRLLNQMQRAMIAAAHKAGNTKIYFLTPEKKLDLDYGACDGHTSLSDNQKMAAWLTGYIETHPELWQGK